MLERDLYAPVRALLEERGYAVQAEVAGCDVLGVRGEECCAVELKLRLNLDVIVQAVARQRFADTVLVAVPAPGRAYYTARFRDVCRVLRRLDVGLVTVRATGAARVDFEAGAHGVRRNARLRRQALTEFAARRTDRGVGGVTRVPLMTAYRERSLTVAALLRPGAASAVALRALGAPDDAYPILYRNPYGWFTRLGGGRYELSALGRAALEEHAALLPLLLPAAPSSTGPAGDASADSSPAGPAAGSAGAVPADSSSARPADGGHGETPRSGRAGGEPTRRVRVSASPARPGRAAGVAAAQSARPSPSSTP